MDKSTTKILPQWYKDFTKKDLILSNDIDSLLSIKLLEQVNPEWKLKYFYDFDSGLFYTGEKKGKSADAVGVDIALDYKDLKGEANTKGYATQRITATPHSVSGAALCGM